MEGYLPFFSCPLNKKCENRQYVLSDNKTVNISVNRSMESRVLLLGETCNFEIAFPQDSRPGDRIILNFFMLDNAEASVAVG